MQIALIGCGKTGSKVADLLSGSDFTIFNTKNTPNKYKLRNHDVIICFTPGKVFLNLIPMLIETQIPVVTGSTGFDWPKDIHESLKSRKLKWANSSNFSLGMNLIYEMIQVFKKAPLLFDDYQFSLNEIHHKNKLDSPSGTAILWENWLGEKMEITSIREGDAVGTHELILDTENESISIKHSAKDRKVFAQGAVWAAHQLVNNKKINPGLHQFNELIRQEMKETNNED